MEKTLTTTLLAILMCVCVAFGFAACGNKCEHAYDNACDTTCNECGETREISHTPEEDDGDCTTAVKCSICGTETTAAKAAHTPEKDDGDCTTAVKCSVCGTTTTEAKAAHEPEEDDGDCTTAVKCSVCGTVTTEAKSHTPEEDDGDCLTARNCTVCEQVAVASYTAHSSTDTDENWTCDNPGCEQLIPGTLNGLVFTPNEDGESYTVTGVASDFEGTEVTIPATVNGKPVTAIGANAFSGYANMVCQILLTSVTIPDSVETIGEYAFSYCIQLKSVTFGENSKLETIGVGAFTITGLKSVTIPASVEEIDYHAFYNCGTLTRVYYNGTKSDWDNKVSKGIDAIPSNATVYCYSEGLVFTQNKDEDGNLLDSYSVTGLGSFKDTVLVIPSKYNGKSVTAIGESAFNGCTSLTSVNIPASVTTIGVDAFADCTGLTSVTFGEGSKLTTISQSAFNGCTDLTSVIIPTSVETIGEGAFSECENLTRVYYDGTASAWAEVSVGEEAIPATATVYYYSASLPTDEGDYWYYLGNVPAVWEVIAIEQIIFELNEDGKSYSVKGLKDGFEGTVLVIPATYEGKPVTAIGESAFSGSNKPAYLNLVSVTIPASVETIGDNAFYGWCIKDFTLVSKLTSVIFEANSELTTIGREVFFGCYSLTSVTIPASVEKIGNSAFEQCLALTSVVIPASVTTIGAHAFAGCTALTSVIIPDSVTTIDRYAFGQCTALTSVMIPDSVTEIGNGAFEGCTELTSVYYGGTEADWEDVDKITIGYNAIPTNATVYYYSENKPEGEGNYWHYVDGVPTTEWEN